VTRSNGIDKRPASRVVRCAVFFAVDEGYPSRWGRSPSSSMTQRAWHDAESSGQLARLVQNDRVDTPAYFVAPAHVDERLL
jgi:hypothetical protein